MNQLMAKKIEMTQSFSEGGKQLPVTVLEVQPAVVTRLRTLDQDGYEAIQVGYGSVKPNKVSRPVSGQIKNIAAKPRHFREERVASLDGVEVGSEVLLDDVIKVGDMVSVSARSKGKGFQGGVKRWGFAGGPKTHGQSDRHRAPGSIGSGTDPGRVWKGLHMAGHMGHRNVTVSGLEVVSVEGNRIMLKGAVPGSRSTWVKIVKQG
jgi:large subunit ribosomal protein L3